MSRAPSGDGINRCREAVDAIQSATSHKYSRDRAELVHLLGSPHFQVSYDFMTFLKAYFLLCTFLRSTEARKKGFFVIKLRNKIKHMGDEIAVNLTINNLPGSNEETKTEKEVE